MQPNGGCVKKLIEVKRKDCIWMLMVGIQMLGYATAWAQAVPTWLNMASNKTRAVAAGATPEAAVSAAAEKLLESNGFQPVEAGSLYMALTTFDSVTVDLKSAPVEALAQNSKLKVSKRYDDGLNSWAYCELTAKDYKAVIDSLHQAVFEVANQYLTEGRRLEMLGDFYGAAMAYANGLNRVTPVMGQRFLAEDGSDIAITLYKKYTTVFNGISITLNRSRLPMVPGEDIPVDIQLQVTKDNLPVCNFPISVNFDREGKQKARFDRMTSLQGSSTIHISVAPQADSATVFCQIDNQALAGIPETMASEKLDVAMKMLAMPHPVRLVAFDPTASVYCSYAPEDSAVYADDFAQLVTDAGYKVASDSASADLVLSAGMDGEFSSPMIYGDYRLVNFTAQMTVQLRVRETGAVLAENTVSDFQVTQPAMKEEARIRAFAAKTILKRQLTEFTPKVKKAPYNKRSVVYSKVK
jgi:hypothetical protein